jgi:hypothetical protein
VRRRRRRLWIATERNRLVVHWKYHRSWNERNLDDFMLDDVRILRLPNAYCLCEEETAVLRFACNGLTVTVLTSAIRLSRARSTAFLGNRVILRLMVTLIMLPGYLSSSSTCCYSIVGLACDRKVLRHLAWFNAIIINFLRSTSSRPAS